MSNNLTAAYLALQAALSGATDGDTDALICLGLAENGDKLMYATEAAINKVLSPEEDQALQDGGYYLNQGEASRVRFPNGKRDWAFTLAWETLGRDVDGIHAQAAAELESKAELRAKDRQVKHLMSQAMDDARWERILRGIEAKAAGIRHVKPLRFDPPARDKRAMAGVATLFISDTHWGETVDIQQTMGLNEYNLDIANERLQRVFTKALELCFTHMSGQWYEGCVVQLGGDMVSGIIHEELTRTNDAEITDCIVDLAKALYVGVTAMADAFGSAYVPCVVGNHGRLEKDKVAKGKVKQNYDYLVYRVLKGYLSNDERVQVDISPSADLMYRVYDTGFLLSHGDMVKSAGGVGGIWPSLLKADYRKRLISQYRTRLGVRNATHDYLTIGHFHQYGAVESIIVNGSLKGYDEYALGIGCKPEPAQQALWFTHPAYGITTHMPVIAQDLIRDQELPPITPMQGMTSL
jgi:hypothetical protein